MDKGQTLRYSKDEIELMRLMVKSREDFTLILRDHFLQLPLDASEKQVLSSLSTDKLELLRKVFLPELRRDVPLTTQSSAYSGLANMENTLPQIAILHIEAIDLVKAYFEQQFDLLTSDEKPTIVLNELASSMGVDQDELRVVNVLAYNKIIPLVEARIQHVLVGLTAEKVETDEEQKKKEEKNSLR